MRGPLEGTRGIVLTQAWAGTYCTQLMGFMGADLIQIEVRKRPDSWRGAYDAPMEAWQDHPTAKHPWNCNFLYNSVNLNKRCITLDLQTAAGLETFRRLLPHADFVAENFSPRVLGNLGIGYEAMRAIKPDVILCSLSAYGHDGTWANVPGIGGTIEPTSGMSALLGYPGGPPLNSGQMYPDAVAGLNAFAAILTALHHRNRTGEGQYIDLSMQDANLVFAGDAALEFLRTGHQRERMGNRHHSFAPYGIYPCAGEDQWIAIACESEDDWQALMHALGTPSQLSVGKFLTCDLRKANEDALDVALANLTAVSERGELVEKLSAAGLAVAPVLDAREVACDSGLREREAVVEVTHAEVGTYPHSAIPWNYSRSGRPPVRPAPLHGEHSFEVLSELLGMSREDYDQLEAAGISGMGPPD